MDEPCLSIHIQVGGYGCKVEIAIWLLDYGIYFEGDLFFIVLLELSIKSGSLYTNVEGPLTMSLNPCLGLPLGLRDKDYFCGLHSRCSSLQNAKQSTHMQTETKRKSNQKRDYQRKTHTKDFFF